MNNLKDIHNCATSIQAGMSGCYIRISMNNLKDIHNKMLTQQWSFFGCYIRISMNNLKDIHNSLLYLHYESRVVILGFQ